MSTVIPYCNVLTPDVIYKTLTLMGGCISFSRLQFTSHIAFDDGLRTLVYCGLAEKLHAFVSNIWNCKCIKDSSDNIEGQYTVIPTPFHIQ